MNFINRILGFRDFVKKSEIIDKIKNSFRDSGEVYDSSTELIIFETTRQKTWLISTNKRLYCILDDIDKNTVEIRWNIDKIEAHSIILNLDYSYKEKVAKADFGNNHKGWKISKKLFKTENEFRVSFNKLIDTMK